MNTVTVLVQNVRLSVSSILQIIFISSNYFSIQGRLTWQSLFIQFFSTNVSMDDIKTLDLPPGYETNVSVYFELLYYPRSDSILLSLFFEYLPTTRSV